MRKNEGEKAENLLMSLVFKKSNKGKTVDEIYRELPKKKVKKIVELFKIAKKTGPVGDNCCKTCGHLHNDAIYKYNRRMKFLRQCEELLGEEKCRKKLA